MADARILIVEDDAQTAQTLELYLRDAGFETHITHDGLTGLAEAEAGGYDLVLLDLMLPGMYGMDVCKRVRQRSNVPIVMLTARALEDDQVRGLELGADDYITKPFSPRQVVARIRSVLRRHRGGEHAVRFHSIELDVRALRLTHRGASVQLTRVQARILQALLQAKGRPLTRDEILQSAFDNALDCSDRNVDAHIKNLRRKIAPAGVAIATTFGIGYRIEAPDPRP